MTRRVLACVRMSPWIEDFRVLPGAVLREHGNEKAPRPELCARGDCIPTGWDSWWIANPKAVVRLSAPKGPAPFSVEWRVFTWSTFLSWSTFCAAIQSLTVLGFQI